MSASRDDPRTRGYRPIHMATFTGNNAKISRLVSSGTDVNTETYYAERIQNNYSNKPVRLPSTYPLLIALKKNNVLTILLLLDLGADPHKPTTQSRTKGQQILGEMANYGGSFLNTFLNTCRQNSNQTPLSHTGRLQILKIEGKRCVHTWSKIFRMLGIERFFSRWGEGSTRVLLRRGCES